MLGSSNLSVDTFGKQLVFAGDFVSDADFDPFSRAHRTITVQISSLRNEGS